MVVKNEQGGILFSVLMITIILVFLSSFLIKSTINETLVANNIKMYRSTFFKTDSCVYSVSNIDTDWVRDDNMLDLSVDVVTAKKTGSISFPVGDDVSVNFGSYEVLRIEKDSNNTLKKNGFYSMNHKAPPGIGMGTSSKTFEIRRFGIKAEAQHSQGNGKVAIEAGVSKYFPKSD